MAIVNMNKITLIGLEADQSQMIETLMKMGVVEINNLEERANEEEWAPLIRQDGNQQAVTKLDTQVQQVQSAIKHLEEYDTRKKGLFATKPVVTDEKYRELIDNQQHINKVITRIGEFDQQLTALRAEENRLSNLTATLDPWQSLTVPLDFTGTQNTTFVLGVIPEITDIDNVQSQLSEEALQSDMRIISEDKDQYYVSVIYYTSIEQNVMEVLKKYGFVRVEFKELAGTVKSNVADAHHRILEIQKERDNIKQEMSELSHEKSLLQTFHDALLIERDRQEILSNMIKTDSVFVLEGWLPEKVSKKVEEQMKQKWECIVDITVPDKEEEIPVLLENHSLVKPFEIVIDLYGLPHSKTLDSTVLMAPFFFVFFGLMVSDAGYGLLMALITGIVLMRFKLEGMAYKLIKLLFFGGISTFLWGAMFGGWFGDIVQVVTTGQYEIPPIWFNPLDDPMRLLIWSFIFGGIHLYVGMGIQAYVFIRDGKVWDAVFDIGLWYVFLTGIVLFALGDAVAAVAPYVTIGGAAGLVLTQGRKQKGILKKALMGILSLYNVTGFLSDVLSYSRLLALGLATGVIATVVNTVGSLFGLGGLGILVLIIVFIGGHTFNILINALGAYVHASRLQYVEFFGKFYEGGGKAFKPFKIKTKYVDFENKEAI